ncbi:MAG: hypothetical protein JO022_02205, partial [Acidobacteriaceae bacterium]|nr:hypothetical protein [Acidobacteriaceae bacterium]
MKEFLRRIQFLFHRAQFNRELEEEMRDHLDRKAADGLSPQGARRQFGNVTLLMEDSRQVWTWTWLEQLAQDVRYAVRTMSANRLFTAMAVISLALGIGANTAIYSFMDAILVRALPVDHPEQLVIFNWRAKKDAPVVQSHWGSSYDDPGHGVTSPNFSYRTLNIVNDKSVLSALFG